MAYKTPSNLSWLEKDTDYAGLSDEDKQFVVEALNKVPAQQLAPIAAQYGSYTGVYKPRSQWSDNDIINMYAQRYGSLEAGKKAFIDEYSHIYRGPAGDMGYIGGNPYKGAKFVSGYGEDALSNAVKNFKTINETNQSDRVVNTGTGWYDTVTGKFYDAPKTESEQAVPTGSTAQYVYNTGTYSPELMTTLQSNPTYYAPALNLNELLGTAQDTADTKTTTTPTTTTTSTVGLPTGVDRAAMDAQVTASFQKNMGRNPTAQELNTYVPLLAKGENVNLAIANLPESSAYGTRPMYGSNIGNISMPTTPNLTGVTMPTVPTFTNYGDTVGKLSMPTYGQEQAGLGLTKYGDTVGGTSPVAYGDQIAGLGVVKYGDQIAGLAPTKYGDTVAGLSATKYGDTVAGLTPTKYGDTVAGYAPIKYGSDVNGIPFRTYGEAIAGQSIPDYAKLVSDPVSAWRFENTDAYNAKKTIMQQELQNQLAARGSLRGAPAVNYLTDQTRKLYSQEYDKERDWFVNQRTAEYQARGLAYADAYAAASQEYNNAYGAEMTAYNTAVQNAQNQYDTALTNTQGLYNTALTNTQGRYDTALTNTQGMYNTAYNATNDRYLAALANQQNLYNTAYTSNLANYQTAVNSSNTNAGERYNMLYGQYGQNLQNMINQYNMGNNVYTNAYNAAATQADAAYNELLNAAKLGQSAVGGTTAAGSASATGQSTAIQNAADEASNSAIQQGTSTAGLYSGLGKYIPNVVSTWSSLNSILPKTTTNTTFNPTERSVAAKGISAFGKTTSPTLQKGLGSVVTTTPKKTTNKSYSDTNYSFNM